MEEHSGTRPTPRTGPAPGVWGSEGPPGEPGPRGPYPRQSHPAGWCPRNVAGRDGPPPDADLTGVDFRPPLAPASCIEATQQAGTGACIAGDRAGLVPNQTSSSQPAGVPDEGRPIDRAATRLRRMRHGVKLSGMLLNARAALAGTFAPWFVTLTYANPDAWRARHVSAFLNRVADYLSRRGFPLLALQVAEIQPKRFRRTGDAVVHFHVVVWWPEVLGTFPKADQAEGRRRAWWTHGSTNRVRARAPVGYLLKYASKGGEFVRLFPKGLRLHSCRGLGDHAAQYSHARRPAWLRDLTRIGERLRRRAGGGWLSLDTGELFCSPFLVLMRGGVPWLLPRARN